MTEILQKKTCIAAFKVVLLCLIVWFAYLFTYRENKAIDMPTDVAIDSYFEKINDNVVKITHVLSSIDSRETADSAVFQLAEIADKNIDAYNQLDVRLVTDRRAVDILHSIWTREVMLWNHLSYKALEKEYIRLRNNNFYNSKSLRCMLSSYFFKEVGNSLVWAFSLTSRIEYTYLLKDESYPHLERNKDYVEEFVDNGGYSLPSNNNDFTLLYLESLLCTHNRGAHDTSGIIKPLYTSVRGEDALFRECFCFNYDFNDNLISNLSPENYFIDNFTDYNPSALKKLEKNTALRLMGFYRKYVFNNHECYVYHLNQPFKSRFLIIHYENASDYPHAIQFANDLSPLICPQESNID